MICKTFEIGKLNLENYNIYLFYGKNIGLQNEILEKCFTNNFNGEINKYEENDFLNNYDLLISEMLNRSLFQTKKIIIISRVSDKIFKNIEDLSKRQLSDTKIILKSNTLEKKSKLRNLFEKKKRIDNNSIL